MKNSHPKIDTALPYVAGDSGEPPQLMMRREDRSSCLHRGLFTRMLIIVEARLVQLMRSRSEGRKATPR